MRLKFVFLVVALILACAETIEKNTRTNVTNIQEQNQSNDKAFNMNIFTNLFKISLDEFLVKKKNIIAAYPFEIAAKIIDGLCSYLLFFFFVPTSIKPNIDSLYFQYITPCHNYSVPVTQADELWQGKHFDRTKKVVIFATGWTNTVNNSESLSLLHEAFLCRNDVNFVVVDAGSYVDTIYKWAVLNARYIGKFIAQGLVQLLKVVPLKNIYLVGHSLGAQIVGFAGRTFTELTGQQLPRITGLDPANPCFHVKDGKLESLQSGDAALVDVIHTNIGILGMREPIADIDFYPGGANPLQPGCMTIGCSHLRAVQYYTESVYPGNEQNFFGYKCDSYDSLKELNCTAGVITTMGYLINTKARGIFYVGVNRMSPFGQNSRERKALWENSTCHICEE